MAWHIVFKYLEQVADHSTLIGKFWVTFFFILRSLLVISMADTIFKDEQGSFVCNTQTPGCTNICFNDFSPISLLRYWALQIFCATIPVIIFVVYTAHKMPKIQQARKIRSSEEEKLKKKKEAKKLKAIELKKRLGELPPEYEEVEKKKKEDDKKEKKEDDDKVVATKLNSGTPSRLMLAYVGQVIFRLTVDVLFTIFQFRIYVFKFWVPELFKCARYPCPNVVDCFVSRPKEKTIMMWVMFGTSLIMIFLSLVELYHLGLKKIWEAFKARNVDITKMYKTREDMPMFGGGYRDGAYGGTRYPRGYPQAVGIRVGYARSSISGEGGNDFDGDQFI